MAIEQKKPFEHAAEPEIPGGDLGFGENIVEFGEGGTVKVTERKSGEETYNVAGKESESAYARLGQSEKEKVEREIERLQSSGEFVHLSPAEAEAGKAEKREELSRKILESNE